MKWKQTLYKAKTILGKEKIRLFFHIGFVTSLCFYREFIPYFLWGMSLTMLFKPNLKQHLYSTLKNKFFQLFVGFYLLHLIGLFYTQDLHEGLFKVQVKLAYFLVPLVIFSESDLLSSKKSKIYRAFIAGVLFSILICSGIAAVKSIYNTRLGHPSISYWTSTEGLPFFKLLFSGHSYFNYIHFSRFVHPSYFSMYMGLVLILLIFRLNSNSSLDRKFRIVFLLAVNTIFVFLLQSRAGIIAYILVLTYFVFYYTSRLNNKLLGVGLVAAVLVGSLTLINTSSRFESLRVGLRELSYDQLKEDNLRLSLWEVSLHIIHDHPIFGVGTGDITLANRQYYTERLFEKTEGVYLATHNDFLQTTVRLGLIGGVYLLWIFLYPLLTPNKAKFGLLLPFLLLTGISFFFESMLERVNGIYFFVYFYCLLVLKEEPASVTSGA